MNKKKYISQYHHFDFWLDEQWLSKRGLFSLTHPVCMENLLLFWTRVSRRKKDLPSNRICPFLLRSSQLLWDHLMRSIWCGSISWALRSHHWFEFAYRYIVLLLCNGISEIKLSFILDCYCLRFPRIYKDCSKVDVLNREDGVFAKHGAYTDFHRDTSDHFTCFT